ncbi:prostate stem cell antigen-like [Gadus chalcogrammus]|uniref:prostate stem cell antigen-like n=1 Tax=Gadus chalcogrammus TaxID=1042646 RepID=UPI0024C47E73|nr:prostate stem cell antigen-like [Gadus chalcogrammus]
MNGIIIRVFAAGLFIAVAHALRCYKCDGGIGNLCLTTEKKCAAGEQCFSGKGEAANFLPIKTKGCLEADQCNKTSDTNIGSSNVTVYKILKTCCTTDLCNAAPGASGLPLLPLLLASFTSLLMVSVAV